jgi:hypothetical protein
VPSLTALLGLVAMYGYVCLAGVVFVAAARTLLCQCNNLVDPGVGVQRAQAVVPGRRHVDAARVHLAARRSVRRSNFPDARSTCKHERQDLSRG